MRAYYLLVIILFVGLFLLRVQMVGGLNKNYQDPVVESVASYFDPMRSHLGITASRLLPEPQGGLLAGMVIGVKEFIPNDFKKALTNTSTIHVVVVSGQNLTLLSGFIMNIAWLLGRKKTIALTLGINIFYAFLTGFQVPVIRAALMVGMVSLAQLFNRESNNLRILLITAGLMLIYNPNWLLSISFQLSFLATIGVVVVAPELIKQLKVIPEILKEDIGVTIAAQLLVLPIIAINFNQLSIFGVLVNSLILFTIPVIMISGALAILISLVLPSLGQLLALIPGAFLTYFVYIIQFFNRDWASVEVKDTNWILWGGYYLVLIAIFLWLKKRNEEVD